MSSSPTNPICPRGHALGSVEGCLSASCLLHRIHRIPTEGQQARAVRAYRRAAIEPLQARVRELETQSAWHDCADALGRITFFDGDVERTIVYMAGDHSVGIPDGWECDDNKLEDAVEALAAKDAELARVRAWAEHFSQLAYDAEGSPLDGWEEVCEAWDEGRLDYLNPETTDE